ncbi:MAG TPA: acyl-CoA dehydrogenase family protein [Acidimicrobiales bacterium]
MITDEHRELRRTVRSWAEADVAPYAAAVDADPRYPDEAWSSYVARGWVRMQYPEAYGGDGADAVSCAILIEELARVCASSSLTALISKLAMTPVLHWGSPELRARYLPRIASGQSQGSYCLSEPDAGSDVASMTTTARRDGDFYVLNGTKCWITNAGVSDLYTVFARTDQGPGHRGISCFVVEREWGVEIGRLESKLGVRGSPTGEVLLRDVRVPLENRVGEEGAGFYIAMGTLDRSRPNIGAQAVGIAQGAIDYAARYLRERVQFGRPLAELQGLQFMLADMATTTEAARLLVYQAMELLDGGDPGGELNRAGAMAKCFASDTAMAVTTDAVQLLGGTGYTVAHPVERFMRDAKVTQIYEGTNQIQRVVIARSLLSGSS